MPVIEHELLQEIKRGRATDWLEGLGLDGSAVRPVLFLSFGTVGEGLKWASKRLSFDGAPSLFVECWKWLLRDGKIEILQSSDIDVGENEWRLILEKDCLCGALCNGPPAMLDWLETKGVGAGFWQENVAEFLARQRHIQHLSSIGWLLQRGVTLDENAVEAVCWLAILRDDIAFLRMIKTSGHTIRPTFHLVQALLAHSTETSDIAEVLEFSLTDLSQSNLMSALYCGRPNVLKWLAKENITPQQCRMANNIALTIAMRRDDADYLEWLWNRGLTLNEFVLSAQVYATRNTHPKVHAWLERKRETGPA